MFLTYKIKVYIFFNQLDLVNNFFLLTLMSIYFTKRNWVKFLSTIWAVYLFQLPNLVTLPSLCSKQLQIKKRFSANATLFSKIYIFEIFAQEFFTNVSNRTNSLKSCVFCLHRQIHVLRQVSNRQEKLSSNNHRLLMNWLDKSWLVIVVSNSRLLDIIQISSRCLRLTRYHPKKMPFSNVFS